VILGSVDMDSDSTRQVQEAIAALGLQDHVQLPGRVPESTLLAWYGAADVFVLPSINAGWKFEGYGLVHMEASAAGLPVIGTRDCGAEDAIDNGVTGLLVPQPAIDDALPQAILSILSDPARARQMGEAGRAKARRETWDHVAQHMVGLYESELRRGGSRPPPTTEIPQHG
jgi:phosphatidylinositol alpha-1,6-mannosyltransferase